MPAKAKGIVGRSDLLKVNPKEIHVDESLNYRREYGDIEELAKNITENGLELKGERTA